MIKVWWLVCGRRVVSMFIDAPFQNLFWSISNGYGRKGFMLFFCLIDYFFLFSFSCFRVRILLYYYFFLWFWRLLGWKGWRKRETWVLPPYCGAIQSTKPYIFYKNLGETVSVFINGRWFFIFYCFFNNFFNYFLFRFSVHLLVQKMIWTRVLLVSFISMHL